MKRLAITMVLVFILAIMSSGCINELVPSDENNDAVSNSSDYELKIFQGSVDNTESLSTTTFYLSKDGTTNVVYTVSDTSVIEIVPMEDLFNTGGDIFTNIVILADSSENVTASTEVFEMFASSSVDDLPSFNYSIEEEVIRGQKHFFMNFDDNITGIVAMTQIIPKGQDLMHVPTHDSTVRFILPEGYTSGNIFIGKAIPDIDDRYTDDLGREVLLWNDLHTKPGAFTQMSRDYLKIDIPEEDLPYSTVIVKFYPKSAPKYLLIGTSILFAGALLVLGSFLSTRRSLRKARETIEGTFDERDKKKNGINKK